MRCRELGKTSTTRQKERSPFSPSLPPNSESLGHVPSCLLRGFTALTSQEEAGAESYVALLRGHAQRRPPSGASGLQCLPSIPGDRREKGARSDQEAQSAGEDAAGAAGLPVNCGPFLFLFRARFDICSTIGPPERGSAPDFREVALLWARAPVPAHRQAPPPLPWPVASAPAAGLLAVKPLLVPRGQSDVAPEGPLPHPPPRQRNRPGSSSGFLKATAHSTRCPARDY